MLSLLISITLCKPVPCENHQAQLLRTFNAVCWVESKGDPNAYNRQEHAAGIAQIRPIMLADANRIIGYAKWDTMSCYDPVQSYEIFKLVVRYYAPSGGAQQWARIWNGGPKGNRKAATLPYWAKVKAQMDREGGVQ